MTIAVGIGMVSCQPPSRCSGQTKTVCSQMARCWPLTGGHCKGTVRSLLVVFVVKLDLFVAHLVQLT